MKLPTTMRAAVVQAFGQPLALMECPVPEPGSGEVLVRILASGVCHTDVHAASGDWPVKPVLPFIPGHEGVGTVAKLGAGVRDLMIGDLVGIAWLHDACGRCDYCITGWETLCESQHNSGYGTSGCFAEYAIGNAAYVARLPEDCDLLSMAPVLCAGVTTYKGLKETEARPGEWVAISGIGGLGHMAVQYAQAMGLRVVALDVGEEKLEIARRLGAEAAIDATRPDAIAEVIEQTRGGAHAALVTAVSPSAFRQALALVRRKGTITLVGLPPGNFEMPIFDLVLKRITVRGSIVGTRKDLAEAVQFAARRKVHACVCPVSLEHINGVLDDLKAGKVCGRAVLKMT